MMNFTDYSSRIIHPLVRALNDKPELRPVAMEVLCAIVTQLGSKYSMFAPLVSKVTFIFVNNKNLKSL